MDSHLIVEFEKVVVDVHVVSLEPSYHLGVEVLEENPDILTEPSESPRQTFTLIKTSPC